jgi:hypothetical protein
MSWIPVSGYCERTGSTETDVRDLILKGKWKEGTHWIAAPDGSIHVTTDSMSLIRPRPAADRFTPLFKSVREICNSSMRVISLPRGSGIYFLIKDRKIQYVGQSKTLMSRIGQHMYEGRVKFDAVSWIYCEPGSLTRMENAYLWLLLPPFNRRITGIATGSLLKAAR